MVKVRDLPPEMRFRIADLRSAFWAMPPALAAVELWQENERKFQELQSKYQQQQAACEQLQQSLQKLERKKADIDLVVRASGTWFKTGKNRIYQVLWQCQENDPSSA